MCLGQVGGVAVSSAIFQSILDRELRLRISSPDADDVRVYLERLINHSHDAIMEICISDYPKNPAFK